MDSRRLFALWLIIFGGYFLVRFWRFADADAPNIIAHHLTDFLFMPWLLIGTTLLFRFFSKKREYVPSIFQISICVLGVSWYFEWWLPQNQPSGHSHTRDWLDVLSYFLGALFTFFVIRKKS